MGVWLFCAASGSLQSTSSPQRKKKNAAIAKARGFMESPPDVIHQKLVNTRDEPHASVDFSLLFSLCGMAEFT
jgi:hypothetical protein